MSNEISVIMGNCVNSVTSKGYKKEIRNQIKCALYFIIVVRLNKLEKEVKRKKKKERKNYVASKLIIYAYTLCMHY